MEELENHIGIGISIHAPRTGSDVSETSQAVVCRSISIHAPRTGSDASPPNGGASTAHFNPRSPHGERPRRCRWRTPRSGFQSTLPARGATGALLRTDRNQPISIHAPRTGSDMPFSIISRQDLPFQSTLPARGATYTVLHKSNISDISIHAPRTGSDRRRTHRRLPCHISIHAPRTGSDRVLPICRISPPDFNPRSPHGERRRLVSRVRWDAKISIHAPRTGSDKIKKGARNGAGISIHAPRTGSDTLVWS